MKNFQFSKKIMTAFQATYSQRVVTNWWKCSRSPTNWFGLKCSHKRLDCTVEKDILNFHQKY
uniref:Uncharacterized protein n=1 Tax=Arundo donax TaxID=35708 RepID=A0A0A9G878_ARUDO